MTSTATRWTCGVVGATGYAGAELARLLLSHPQAELLRVVSRSRAGERLDRVHPGLLGFTDLVFSDGAVDPLLELDVVFLAVPHGSAAEWAAALDRPDGPRIIDLSADHRHAEGWVYGQAEWHGQQLLGAPRIAVPGCFATAISLALAPFVAASAIRGSVQCVAATGSTGAGATASRTTHHPERGVNLKAYKVLRHQHTPEVEAFLRGLGSFERLHFVPLSAPLDRGILASCLFTLQPGAAPPAEVLHEAYAEHAFVRVRSESPELRHVRGTALCDLSVHVDGDQVAVLSGLDNLGKGAAGHAIQCFNAAAGLPAQSGLGQVPCLP